jgi:hypothetical protein
MGWTRSDSIETSLKNLLLGALVAPKRALPKLTKLVNHQRELDTKCWPESGLEPSLSLFQLFGEL